METILEVDSLKKVYGRIHASNNISFKVKKGEVFGLLGPNGSGKTTLLGCICGILMPNGGNINWFEGDDFNRARKKIGAIIETPNFFPYLNAEENLKIVAQIKDCALERIEIVLKEVGLFERRKDAFKKYSLGMKQRLAIAGALLSDPEVLILDEPTNGLDPQGINEIRELIGRQHQKGKTVILASHLLNEVEKVCTEVVILRKGKVLTQGKVDEIISGTPLVAVSAENQHQLIKELEANALIYKSGKKAELIYIELKEGLSLAELNKTLVNSGVLVNHFELIKSDLESEFLKLVQQ